MCRISYKLKNGVNTGLYRYNIREGHNLVFQRDTWSRVFGVYSYRNMLLPRILIWVKIYTLLGYNMDIHRHRHNHNLRHLPEGHFHKMDFQIKAYLVARGEYIQM